MTYLSGKNNTRKKYTKYALLGVIFLAIVFFWLFIKKNMYSVLEPAVGTYGSTRKTLSGIPEFFGVYLTTHKEFARRNEELEARIETLENQLALKDSIIRENSYLVDASSTSESSKNAAIVMYPLVQDVTHLYSTIILSKGFKDGVTVGGMVYIRGYQAVCVIEEVYTSTSRCKLLTASGVTTEGVTSSSSITLPLIGRGGHYLANVARDTPVSIGEKVYLRSNQQMVLGIVKQVLDNNQDTSWHVFVEGAYNPVTTSVFYVQP